MPDHWEEAFGLDPDDPADAALDPDGDGQTNAQEHLAQSHPRNDATYTRYFAEGATHDPFETTFALVNADVADARVLLRFLRRDGATSSTVVPVLSRQRRTVTASQVPGLDGQEFSTVVESDQLVVVDRTMSWDATGYGAHAETAVAAPSSTWYLAEGATHSGFDLFYLLQNPRRARRGARALPASALMARSRRTTCCPPNRGRTSGSTSSSSRPERASLSPTPTSRLLSTYERPADHRRTGDVSRTSPGQTLRRGPRERGRDGAGTGVVPGRRARRDRTSTCFVLIANPGDADADGRSHVPLAGRDDRRPRSLRRRREQPVQHLGRRGATRDWRTRRCRRPWRPSTACPSSSNGRCGGRASSAWHEAHNSAGVDARPGPCGRLAEGEVDAAARPRDVHPDRQHVRSGRHRARLVDVRGRDARREDVRAGGNPGSEPFQRRRRPRVQRGSREEVWRRGQSLGTVPAQIVVERACYWNAGGIGWAAGTNASATRLK